MHTQGKIYTRRLIAQVLGISEKRVKQLTDDGIISEFSHGHYKLLPAVQGYIGYLQSLISDSDDGSNYNIEKARLTKAKREDAELNLQVKRNELHRSADVEFVLTNMLVAFKAKLNVLPHKVLPDLMNVPSGTETIDHFVAVLKKEVAEALEELAAYDPELFNTEAYIARQEERFASEDSEVINS